MEEVRKGKVVSMLKKKLKDNSGMALITVIIACGFLAALVSILLMTTLVNFKMKVVNDRGKDTFYSAEQVLDEINVGLQRRVSDSLSASYTAVMENYDTESNDAKKLRIKTLYYQNLWSYLEVPGSGHQMYDVTKLEEFLKETTKWHTYAAGSGAGAPGEGFGAIIRAVNIDPSGTASESGYGDMITYQDGGIVLKNLKVYYKDYNGFVSVIQTDIRLNLPSFDFAKSSASADIADYCFIADGGAERTVQGDLTFNGNIYADHFSTNKVDTTFGADSLIVVKNDISLDDGSLTTNSGANIWATGLNAKSANVDVSGVLNLSNDLNLTGISPSVKVSGEFNGYGYDNANPSRSSAILLNGKNSKVDLTGVTKLTIAGRAFLGMGKNNMTSSGSYANTNLYVDAANSIYGAGATDDDRYKDVYTGESIAAKSDQLLYLIPAEAIGVDEKTGRSLYNANPLTKKQYLDLMTLVNADAASAGTSVTNYKLVSDSTKIPSFGGNSLDMYTNWSVYKHEVRVNDNSTDVGGALVYLYIMFDSSNDGEIQANSYFQDSYLYNENSKYAKSYVNDVKLPTIRDSKFLRSGRSYFTDTTDAEGDLLGIKVESTLTDITTLEEIHNHYNECIGMFKAYCTKLIPNESELRSAAPSVEGNQVVFENMVSSEARLQSYIDRVLPGVATGSAEFGNIEVRKTNGKKLTLIEHDGDTSGPVLSQTIVATENVDIAQGDVSTLHLVICSKDVTLNATKFDGVILTDGKILFNNSTQVCTKVPDMVYRCLELSYEDAGRGYPVKACLNGGDEYIFDASGNSITSLTNLVTYENWKKE